MLYYMFLFPKNLLSITNKWNLKGESQYAPRENVHEMRTTSLIFMENNVHLHTYLSQA